MPDLERKFSGVSDSAVAAASGKTWDEWIDFLDGLGAAELDHKGIVALTAGPGGLANGWWQQSVAVGYEQAKGLRVVGQTSGADFQIGVQKTLPLPSEDTWALLVGDAGRGLWLGSLESLEFRKGQKYRTEEGYEGEVRSCVPGERLRLTWSHPDLERTSTVQLYLAPSGRGTSVRFHQERLSSLEERELMRDHWRRVLEDLAGLI